MPTGPETTTASDADGTARQSAADPAPGAAPAAGRPGAAPNGRLTAAPTGSVDLTGSVDAAAPGPDAPAGGDPAAPAGTVTRRPGRARRLVAAARRHWLATLVAALAGLALIAAFPPYDVWPLSALSVAVLSVLTRGRTARQGAWLGFALGVPFFVGLLKWLNVVGWDAVVGLAVIEALFFLPLGAGLAVTSRLRAWPLWAACLWVAEEWARDRVPFGGFPWGRLAFANTATPYTPLAALGGAPLVTFAVALTGALLALLGLELYGLRRRLATARAESTGRLPRVALPAVGALALAAATTAAGYAVPVPTEADETVSVAVVQGNVQQAGMDFLGRPMQILNNHVEATLELAEDIEAGRTERPDLVLWPENASDLDPYQEPEARQAIERAVDAVGVPVLVGALVDHPTEEGYVENQGIVWDPETGPGDSYTKQHPVPFGEYVPFREQLSTFISRLDRIPRDFYPGDGPGVLDVGPARLGDVICFEVAYDGIVRDTVNAGARALVVQTNNATYGRTGQPEQQLAMSQLRAVEHGRAIVTAATSGISAIVAPDGTIEQRTEEFTQDVLTAELPLRDDITVADQVGEAPEWALAGLGLAAWGWVGLRARRARREEHARG
ncbi:apolipoprotein N-acyltransferase [Streptomyces sp. B6B3]|uniref:apolipoprotein N-acyltransferase n=1 Tax=Streptomyces sp. B6B3 TaxID=3153570 RepID=UPI00325EF3A3